MIYSVIPSYTTVSIPVTSGFWTNCALRVRAWRAQSLQLDIGSTLEPVWGSNLIFFSIFSLKTSFFNACQRAKIGNFLPLLVKLAHLHLRATSFASSWGCVHTSFMDVRSFSTRTQKAHTWAHINVQIWPQWLLIENSCHSLHIWYSCGVLNKEHVWRPGVRI